MRAQLQLKAECGVRIVRALSGTPAKIACVRPNDVLLSVDGVEVGGVQQAITEIRKHAQEQRIGPAVPRGSHS
jgi:S1-C subfamily serine protease